MKTIFKLSLLALTLLSFSCSEDDQFQVSEDSIGGILTPSTGDSFVLNPFEVQTNTAMTISWEDAIYSVPTQANYTVEVAQSGTNFENAIVVGNTIENALTVNISNLNNYAILAGLFPFVEGQLDIRVKSAIGDEAVLPQYSDAITVSITPFTTDLPKLSVPGNHQGWDPPTAPLLASSAFGETDYEGYVWLDGEYKFLAPDETGVVFEWGNTDWGDDGNFNGVLVETDEVNCTESTAGYYLVKANTDELTYSTEIMNWGIIGNATPTGWDSDTDLIYDPATRTLSITLDLTAQEAPDNGIKFRANDDWGVNLGDTGADGTMEYSGDNIGIPVSGNYTIVLDLSNPREYTYSLTLN
ncbi:MAG: DUF5116 domain-containing protein [Flavobacteriaceae bacterium]|uniref:SusE domain-containing protein n=1 Tax=Winogradskyella sp. SYSU M77433 TaxID=3042722 RepID=UPI000C35B2F2|nr:SusE domain-containing protein [Winogradskyella sp. SYSU M77433]MAX71461.1 DUF5116 domain-containing protein [Flavobacteriaceae bacterium]MDH7911932.1 SusE domain-containing protein [Winogradskyella sp. SYSU M77433]